MIEELQQFGSLSVAHRTGGAPVELMRSKDEVVFLAFDNRIRRLVELHVLRGGSTLDAALKRFSRPSRAAVSGFDLTFSPVKSVSTLWAIAPREIAEVIEQAHDKAVADALRLLEREALFTREGKQGARQVETRGLIATAFTHRDSRAGDPDLHTHVAVANKVQTKDGKWLSIYGRVLYESVVAVSETYNTALERHLVADLGLRFEERPDTSRGRPAIRGSPTARSSRPRPTSRARPGAPGTGGSAGAAGPTPARHPPGPGSAPGPRRSSDRGGAPRPRRLPRTRSPPTPRRSRPQTPAGVRPARRGRGAGDGHPAATGSGGAGCRTCGSTAPGDAGRVHWTPRSPASGVRPAGGAGPAHTPRSRSAPWHPPEPQPVPTAAAGARAKPTGRRPSCGEAGPYRKGKAVAPHS